MTGAVQWLRSHTAGSSLAACKNVDDMGRVRIMAVMTVVVIARALCDHFKIALANVRFKVSRQVPLSCLYCSSAVKLVT